MVTALGARANCMSCASSLPLLHLQILLLLLCFSCQLLFQLMFYTSQFVNVGTLFVFLSGVCVYDQQLRFPEQYCRLGSKLTHFSGAQYPNVHIGLPPLSSNNSCGSGSTYAEYNLDKAHIAESFPFSNAPHQCCSSPVYADDIENCGGTQQC